MSIQKRIFSVVGFSLAVLGCQNRLTLDSPNESTPEITEPEKTEQEKTEPEKTAASAGETDELAPLPSNVSTTSKLSEISYLMLTKSEEKSYAKLNKLTLTYYSKGELVESIEAVSGQPDAQLYTSKKAPGKAGNNKPIPEGLYFLGKPIESRAPGVGQWFIPIVPDPKPRGDFGIHLDANRSTSPGTAGCVGMPDSKLMTKVLAWLKRPDKPTLILINWQLGTVASVDTALKTGQDIASIKSEGNLSLSEKNGTFNFPYDRVPTELIDVTESLLPDSGEEISN